MISKSKLFIFTFCMFTFFAAAERNELPKASIDKVISIANSQSMSMYAAMKNQPNLLPRSLDEKGELVTSIDSWWTSGFFPGTMWYLYELNPSNKLKEAATKITQRVVQQQYTKDNHDVGFIINCSFGNKYRLFELPVDKQILITAANSLSTRFNPKVGCIRSWNNKKWEYPVIIDNMMNLELLCEATKLTGDSSYYKIAVSHADTTMKYHFRPDGSSYHLVSYDTINGGFVERITHQGYSNESAWARGQAWGLYGYTMMYRETKKPEYLKMAIKIAEFIINNKNLPKDKIPYWDFNAPDIPNALRDASAGAVMASALLELSTFADAKNSDVFYETAQQQLRTLMSDTYLAKNGENGNFILKHSVGFMAKKSEIDVPLSYADYYFIEALIRYKKLENTKERN